MSNKGLEKGPEHIPDEIIGLGLVSYFRFVLPDELKRHCDRPASDEMIF